MKLKPIILTCLCWRSFNQYSSKHQQKFTMLLLQYAKQKIGQQTKYHVLIVELPKPNCESLSIGFREHKTSSHLLKWVFKWLASLWRSSGTRIHSVRCSGSQHRDWSQRSGRHWKSHILWCHVFFSTSFVWPGGCSCC